FDRSVAGHDHHAGPRAFRALLLLDRPQQAARLVAVGVVRPAVERRKTLLARAGATAAVRNAVRACAVPGHADHQTAIVTEIGRPPLLRLGHQRTQIPGHGAEVERPELLAVLERLAHPIGQTRIAV